MQKVSGWSHTQRGKTLNRARAATKGSPWRKGRRGGIVRLPTGDIRLHCRHRRPAKKGHGKSSTALYEPDNELVRRLEGSIEIPTRHNDWL